MTKAKNRRKVARIIDLADHVDNKKHQFLFDFGDFYFEWQDHIKDLKDIGHLYLPKYDMPKDFTQAEQIKALNYAINRADEQGYIDGYTTRFHDKLIRNLNDMSDQVKFEYKECYQDKITLKVYYKENIDQIVADEPVSLDDRLSDLSWSSAIDQTRAEMENYNGDRDEVAFIDYLQEKISEIRTDRKERRKKIRTLLRSNKSERAKIGAIERGI